MGSLIGYARVSTAEQSVDLQTDELRAAGCVKVFTEQMSGAVDRRPELDRALEQLRAGDTLVVWRLDRLGRSLRHLIDTVTGLDAQQVGSGRCARASIRRPRVGGWCFTCSGRWRSLSGRSSGTGRSRVWRRRGPGAGSGDGHRS